MKKLIYILMLAVFVGSTATNAYAQKKGTKLVCFKSDMDCGNCEKTIAEYVKFEKGVKDLRVDHASNTIAIEYKEGKTSDEKLAKAIKKKGYKAEKISKEEYEKLVAHVKEHGHEHGTEEQKEKK